MLRLVGPVRVVPVSPGWSGTGRCRDAASDVAGVRSRRRAGHSPGKATFFEREPAEN